jgi:hypothetical protein
VDLHDEKDIAHRETPGQHVGGMSAKMIVSRPRRLLELEPIGAKVANSPTQALPPGIPHSDGSLPVQDGYVIPGDTYELYAAGKQAKIPLLIGYADEHKQGARRGQEFPPRDALKP